MENRPHYSSYSDLSYEERRLLGKKGVEDYHIQRYGHPEVDSVKASVNIDKTRAAIQCSLERPTAIVIDTQTGEKYQNGKLFPGGLTELMHPHE